MAQTPEPKHCPMPLPIYSPGMAISHVLSGLHKKRARMAGEIEAAEQATASKRETLATLDAVIRVFSPECRPDMIPSVRPYLRGLFFGYRELSRLTLDALREAGGPVRLAQIAEWIATYKGLPIDARLRRSIRDAARGNLFRMERRGTVRRILDEPDTWWELTGRWP
jgi:hypothetical protein